LNPHTPKLDTSQTVELAEGVEIRLRIAGPLLRIAAYAVDWAIKLLVMALLAVVLALAGFAFAGLAAGGVWLLVVFVMEWFYPMVFEAGRRGATPGKRMLGLRVVRVSGSPISLGQAFVRNILRWVDGMPFATYGFGMVSCLATRRFQRLGDLAAGTVVVYARQPAMPALAAPPPVEPVPVPVALSADETRALVLFRERAGLWSAARREEIANQLAGLSGADGAVGVSRLMAMAHWVQERKPTPARR
jgi:uncharacterized RDD family membrane protein YckC